MGVRSWRARSVSGGRYPPGWCFLTDPGVTVVDYGLGNIQAFVHIYQRLNIPVSVASTVDGLAAARKLILPGVGAFDWAMSRLNASGLRDTLDRLVLQKRIPVLGVCVGMQMMTHRSEEGSLPGLGWVDADVVRFDSPQVRDIPLPHMGWNDVHPVMAEGLFRGLVQPRYYFLHSYYVASCRPADVVATSRYGTEFCAAFSAAHIYGTQFHPEKSHRWGVDLLRNFAEL